MRLGARVAVVVARVRVALAKVRRTFARPRHFVYVPSALVVAPYFGAVVRYAVFATAVYVAVAVVLVRFAYKLRQVG